MTFLKEKCLFERNFVVSFYSAFDFLRAFLPFLDLDLKGFESSVLFIPILKILIKEIYTTVLINIQYKINLSIHKILFH